MKRVLRTVACAVSILTLSVGATAQADTSGGGAQRWSADYAHGAPAVSADVALSADGSTVFVTGVTDFGPSGRMATLAYGAADGERRWVDTFPGTAGDQYGVGKVLAVSADGSMLFVSGFSDCASE